MSQKIFDNIAGRTLRREHGQTMAEYAVVLAVISVAAIAAFTLLGTNVSGAVNWVASQIKSGP